MVKPLRRGPGSLAYITYTSSKVLNTSMTVVTDRKKMVGRSWGMVMCQKRLKARAPSSRAA